MKEFLALFILILILSFISCNKSSDNTTNSGGTNSSSASIFIDSHPSGAQIFQGNFYTNKITPDSITNLNPGHVSFTLKLFNYKDTTFITELAGGQKKNISISLTFATDLASYGSPTPIRIWETYNSPATIPNGIILFTGRAVPVSNDSIDIFYYGKPTGPFELRSANLFTGRSRQTFFKMGNSSDLNDHVQAPEKDSTWIQRIDFSIANGNTVDTHYFFMYDQNGHYAKVKIYVGGGAAPGDFSTYADFTWYYNRTIGSRDF